MAAAGPTRGSSGRARFGESKRHFAGAAEPLAVGLTLGRNRSLVGFHENGFAVRKRGPRWREVRNAEGESAAC